MYNVNTTTPTTHSPSIHTSDVFEPTPVVTATKSTNYMSNSDFVLDDLIQLRDKHDVWFTSTYKASNDELYRLLAKCLEIYQRMTKKRAQIAAFEFECVRRKLKFKKTTSLIHRIVKYVFAVDNKRVSRYAKVLTVAQADGPVDPMNLHTWIAAHGGIEEVQAKHSGRPSTAARAKANMTTGIAAAKTASAQQTYSVPGFSIDDASSAFVAVLARVNDAGVIELIAPIADKHAIEAVLAAYGADVATSKAANNLAATVNAQNDATFAALNS